MNAAKSLTMEFGRGGDGEPRRLSQGVPQSLTLSLVMDGWMDGWTDALGDASQPVLEREVHLRLVRQPATACKRKGREIRTHAGTSVKMHTRPDGQERPPRLGPSPSRTGCPTAAAPAQSFPIFTCTSFPAATSVKTAPRNAAGPQPTLPVHQLEGSDAAASGASLPGLGNAGLL